MKYGGKSTWRISTKKTSTGDFELADAGDVSDKLSSFRENNRALNAVKQALEAEVVTLTAEVAALKAAPPAADPQALTELTTAKTAAEAALAAERLAHGRTALKNAVSFEFLKAGGRPDAAEFIVEQAAKVFETGPTGTLTTTATGLDGKLLTLPAWLANQAATAAFAFAPSRGGDAERGKPGQPTRPTISSDPVTVGRNLEALASGKVTVDVDR